MNERRNRRAWRIVAVVAVLTVPLLLVTWNYVSWHTNRPFETAHTFIHHLRNEQFDHAKAMIVAEDLGQIPVEYWEQFRGRPPESGIAPTFFTLVNGRMSMIVFFSSGEAAKLDIRYEVIGDRIRVKEITWPLPTPYDKRRDAPDLNPN